MRKRDTKLAILFWVMLLAGVTLVYIGGRML